jgi:predicted metal-dependent hydrolase
MAADPEYDPRYLGGIVLFNRHDFFDAHEVWESLWIESSGPERRFIQGLIQAAVALVHFGNGNLRGAAKLFRSGRDYMTAYGPVYMGLDGAAFWRQMEACFADVLTPADPPRQPELDESRVPTIALDPPPAQWPDPEPFLRDD